MRKILYFFVLLLLVSTCLANDWIYRPEYLIMGVEMSSEFEAVSDSSDYELQYIIANLSFFPRDDNMQEVLSMETEPETDVAGDVIPFRWDDPLLGKYSFSLKSSVKVKNRFVKVAEKADFPIKQMPVDVLPYIDPTTKIDSDDKDIIAQASEIASGEDDLFIVLGKLADWTKTHVEYDLSTLTADVSQKASWVLENREGVCDEITNLFIAMARSLGIPARFVSGYAYTNEPTINDWGPHGWAEVYFPSYGWVPYDVTYGEYGFLDVSHIKMRDSFDPDEASTAYRWLGHNVDVEINPLKTKISLDKQSGRIADPVKVSVDVYKDPVSFGSYNIIEGIVENLNDYYIATDVTLSKPPEISIDGKEMQVVYLKPKEKKSVYWIVRVDDGLRENYAYTFPLVVASSRNITGSATFSSAKGETELGLVEVKAIIEQKKEELAKVYSRNVDMSCSIDNEEFYEYESAVVACVIKNSGNVMLSDVNVCYGPDCEVINLGITQEHSLKFNIDEPVAGNQQAIVTAKNNFISKSVSVPFEVFDKPKIEVSGLEFPSKVEYDDEFSVKYVVKKVSFSSPVDISMKFNKNGVLREWTIEELAADEAFEMVMQGKDLKAGVNEFKIELDYFDKNGKSYSTTENFKIELVNVTFFQKIILFFRGLGEKVSGFGG